MVAAQNAEVSLRVREIALLDILDPSPVDGQWDFVLGFACRRASMTTDAFALIYYPGEICHARSSRRCHRQP